MKIIEKLKKVFISFENIISAEHSCLSCGCEILDGMPFQLCEKCYCQLEKISGRLCLKCGDVLSDGKLKCEFCNGFNYAFDSSRSIFHYNEVSSNLVKGFKYGGRKYYSKHMAKLITEDLSIFKNIDIITFVPISKNRERVRGFNQAEELAKEISLIVGISVKNLLLKTFDNKHQAGLNQKDRLENLKGTFKLNDLMSNEIKGKNILIIDDVFTTGATLSECASIIKMSGCKKVCALTFAKTKLISSF